MINKRVITPSPTEVQLNPRSRSAKLRAAERIITQDESYKVAEKLNFLAGGKANGWRRPHCETAHAARIKGLYLPPRYTDLHLWTYRLPMVD
ncbi:unnamed protein product [marine sediment metagenome]|uniref:Uncharacterized protein n=1 Tax=marine sediment metagenome TaxID=412755 RepID=X1B2Y4_9ZZZZ